MKLKYIAGLTSLFLLAGCDVDTDSSVEPIDMQSVSSYQGEFEAAVGYEGDRVFFGFDQYKVPAKDDAKLRKMVDWIKEHPGVQVNIEGHCDERGTSEYNMGLGMRRAEAMKKALERCGLDCTNVSVTSYGKERPAVPGSNEAAYAKNRRAVIVIIGD